MKVHPTAVVSPLAVIHSGVEIGPFCTVEAGAVLGQGCRLAARATVKSNTILGRDAVVGEGAVLGGGPQHLTPPSNPGRVVIGERCVIRENVTVHRSMTNEGETRVGNDCLLMVNAHVAHDCRVGNRVILTNSVLLGGHVQVGERAVLGGGVAVHQHCRVGRLSMLGGCARAVQDVPPFMLTDGDQGMIVGLNNVGLRRAGIEGVERNQLKAAYRLIFRRGLMFAEMLEALEREFPTGPASEFAEFFRHSKRGFLQERRRPPRVAQALRLHTGADDESADDAEGEIINIRELKRKAG